MTMKDTTLQVFDIRALDVGEGDEHATLAMMTGLAIPGPNGQAMVLPAETYRVPMDKSAIAALIESLQVAHDALPDPRPQTNLFVPGSMTEAEQIANNLKRFN